MMILKTTTTATTLMILANNMPSALSSEPKLRGATSSSAYLATDSRVIEQADMDGLADAFCGAAVAISDAFWENGGQHHTKDNAYPQEACDAAYEVALGALNGAYNYPEPVLFKPTLTTAPYTFRPTKAGALSYFIGTDCLLKSGTEDEQFPPGNDGSDFREYGFGLANYGPRYSGFSGCEWVGDSYVTGEAVGVAQGQIFFERNEGTTSVVDKTFSFGYQDGGVVITGHHSSQVVDDVNSNQYVFGDEDEEESM